MTFIYPAVLTPHKENEGYHVTFPDLVGCEADGPDLQDALENARAAAYDWGLRGIGGRRPGYAGGDS